MRQTFSARAARRRARSAPEAYRRGSEALRTGARWWTPRGRVRPAPPRWAPIVARHCAGRQGRARHEASFGRRSCGPPPVRQRLGYAFYARHGVSATHIARRVGSRLRLRNAPGLVRRARTFDRGRSVCTPWKVARPASRRGSKHTHQWWPGDRLDSGSVADTGRRHCQAAVFSTDRWQQHCGDRANRNARARSAGHGARAALALSTVSL
jgi:hypothetical protein